MGKQSEATLLLKIKSAGEGVLSKTKAALGDIRTWAAAAFAALTSGAAVSAFKEAEEATNKLNQALVNQGIYTKDLSDDYQQMATDLQGVTTFEDDAIVNAQATMQSYLGQTKISKELMKATLDLAAAKKIDLASAAEMVGKSIGTGTNALARQGVKFEEGATKGEKMAKVLSSLTTLAGGQAEAQAKGLGAITQAKNAVGNLLEAVGEKLAPFITMTAQAITRFANSVINNKQIWSFFEMVVIGLARSATVTIHAFKALGTILYESFETVFDAVSRLASGDFKGALEAVKTGWSNTSNALVKEWDDLGKDLSTIDNAYAKREQEKQEESLKFTKEAGARKKKIVEEQKFDEEAFFKTMDEKELQRQKVHSDATVREHVKGLNEKIKGEKDLTTRQALEREKRKYLDERYNTEEKSAQEKMNGFMKSLGIQKTDEFRTALNDMSAMQNSKSKEMQVVGKAAAIANIAIKTAEGAMNAYAALSMIPAVGPGLGIVASGLLITFGAEQAANVAGVQLADGGIVRARPGGVHAIIGEGGRDEAVIPLDDSGGPIMGTTVNIMVQGGFLGDVHQAKEFAIAVDRQLFRLRQSNQSMAFDKGVI